MSLIVLPHEFEARQYQSRALEAFFKLGYKHLCLVWHRRAGKTKLATNVISGVSQRRVGAYFYLFPQLKQARRSLWEARGSDGVKFIDHFSPQLIKRVNNQEMYIEFKNGSIFRLLGSDQYDKLMGTNPLGVIYDEYSLQNPYAREYLLPILAENGGWEIFIYTPRGGNHGYSLYQSVKDNKKWYTELLTVDDSRRTNGEPIVTRETIDDLIASGWSENKVEQEFYCSFEAAVSGAYFAKQLQKAHADERIHDFPIDVTLPVHTYWDLGWRDSTAIWFAQETREGLKVINYYENRLEPLSHYFNYINDFRDKEQIFYGTHYAPHDASKHDQMTGQTLITRCRQMGLNFKLLKRLSKKSLAIEYGRGEFSKMTFHATNTKRGLDCLREYHASYNEAMGVFSKEPDHNWASHGADAYLYMAQAYRESREQTNTGRVYTNRVNTDPIFDD